MKNIHPLAIACLSVSVMALAACSDFTSSTKSAYNADDGGALSDEAMQHGRMLFARGEYALAIDQFKKVVRFSPNSPAGYNGLAASYDMLGRFDVSREYYELALARSPEDPMILRNIERSLAMQGRGLGSNSRLSAAKPSYTPPYANVASTDDARADDLAPAPPVMAAAPDEEDAKNQLMRMSGKVVELKTAGTGHQPIHHGAMPRVEIINKREKVTVAISPVKDWTVGPPTDDIGIALNGAPTQNRAKVAIVSNKVKPVRNPSVMLTNAQTRIPTIKILNAAGTKGVARKTQIYLARKGTGGTSIGDARKQLPESWIIYPASQSAQANALRKNLPFGTRVHVDAGFERVVILVGENAAARLTRSRGT